ncbi:MAG: M23 family metallopeptidase [Armatimonadetes bacterium]|nr:M23 family metallopeptidase [Armatimonadota bacterium]
MLVQLLQQLLAQQGGAAGAVPGADPSALAKLGEGSGVGGGTADAAGFGKKSGGGGGAPIGSAGNGGSVGTQNAPNEAGGATASGGGEVIPYNGKQVKPLENYRVSSEFGPRNGKQHSGIDLAAPMGTAVRSFRDGEVVRVANDPSGYGNYIDVKHPDGTTSRYAHLSAQNVQVGQKVGAGSTIGKVGSTGNSTGPHLHFEVRDASGNPMNPRKVMNF